jgi:hypothetical protein
MNSYFALILYAIHLDMNPFDQIFVAIVRINDSLNIELNK